MTIFVLEAETRILCSGYLSVASLSEYLLNFSCRKTSSTSWRMQPPVDTRPSPYAGKGVRLGQIAVFLAICFLVTTQDISVSFYDWLIEG